jgi:hypothetical protein
MDASLVLNNHNQLALLYTEDLDFTPEWACVDVQMQEIYVGGPDVENLAFKLDEIDRAIYDRVYKEKLVLLVQVADDREKTPLKSLWVPLMVSRHLKP